MWISRIRRILPLHRNIIFQLNLINFYTDLTSLVAHYAPARPAKDAHRTRHSVKKSVASQFAQMTSRNYTLTIICQERVYECLPAYSWLMMRVLLRAL